MHHRIVSYALLAGTIFAVLLVTVIQPHEAAFRKKKLKDMREFLLAQTQPCSPGMYGGCAPPPITPFGGGGSSSGGSSGSLGGETSGDGSGGTGGSSDGSGSSGGGETINGISAKEKERITTECLEYLIQPPSGYAEVEREYGLFTNILDSAVNSCENAYLSTRGKFGNNDLNLLYDLLLKNKPPIGFLYQAFQKTPAPLKGQSITDYINVNKEGAAKYLKCLGKAVNTFAETTSVTPKYLANPLPYVTAKNAAEYNKNNSPAIKSLEEELTACVPVEPKKEDGAAQKEVDTVKTEPAPQQTIVKPAPQVKPAEPETISAERRMQTLIIKMFNKLRAIRDAFAGITRTKISPDIGIQKRNFEKQVKIIKTFTLCREKGIC